MEGHALLTLLQLRWLPRYSSLPHLHDSILIAIAGQRRGNTQAEAVSARAVGSPRRTLNRNDSLVAWNGDRRESSFFD